jgi:hypothetical protein
MAYEEDFEEYNGDDVTGIVKIHGGNGGWTVWELSGDQPILHVFNVERDSIDVSISTWE